MNRRTSRLVSLLLSFVFLAVSVTTVMHWQEIFDWWRLRDYQPPAAIAALAETTTMTPKARKLFYVHYPQLDEREAFNQHCSNGEQTIVLGCYVRARGIYLFHVTDPRLSGVQEVTAAHEMLHAAYDRLSSSERQRIDTLTAQAFANLADERLKGVVSQYRAKDPNVVPNELHSILGTEVRTLPPELEAYYQAHFSDRAKVVSFAEHYEAEFTTRKQKLATYDTQLAQLKESISAAEANLDAQAAALNADRSRLDALLASQNYATYNASVEGFNARVRQYNALVKKAQADIDRHNTLVVERNNLALEEQDLIKALDSHVQPQTTE